MTGLAIFKCFQRDLSVNFTQNYFWDRSSIDTTVVLTTVNYIILRYTTVLTLQLLYTTVGFTKKEYIIQIRIPT